MDKSDNESSADPLFCEAKALVIREQRASLSMVQRKLKIGYMRAGNLIDALEDSRIVSSPTHNGHRTVLVSETAYNQKTGERNG